VLVLAGLLAVITLGGAAWLLFRDGMPFGEDGARLAGDLGDPAVTNVLNGTSGAEFAAVDGAPERPSAIEIAPLAPATDAALEEPASAPIPPGAVAAADAAPGEAADAAPAEDAAEPAATEMETATAAPEQMAEPEAPAAIAGIEAPPPAPAAVESEPVPAARILSGAPATTPGQVAEAQPPAVSPAPSQSIEGDPAAQFQLGEAQLQGGSPEEGARLIQSAASQGYPPAQYRLGKLYETGTAGVPRDDVQARMWTERAAVAGNRNAMHNLGLMYAEGRGAEQSDQTAAQWFERAAQIGATDSQFNLAVLYEQGRGVPQSLADAYAWYRISERAGDTEAGERANLLAAQIPQDAIAEADRVAQAFQPGAADAAANGAAARPLQTAAPAPADQVLRAQQLLAGLGYNPGAASGAIGPETRQAIVQYQRDTGMAETGAVDTSLLASLEAAAAR
jgi:localization factor PodJL